MATYNPNHSSILDTPSGHVGPVIFYIWKGISCVRSMPQHYRDARTHEQLQNRSKLSVLMAFQSRMKPALKNGYQYNTNQTSELNEATRINYHTALTTHGTTAHINYPSTYLSWGTLPQLLNLQYLVLNNQLLIHWDPQTILNPSDQVHIALYNQTRHTSQYHPHIATRHDQGVTLPIPQSWQHDTVHLWLWLNGSAQNSTSQYLGTLSTPTSNPTQADPCTPSVCHYKTQLQTLDSQPPKCYQTALSLGSDSYLNPPSVTPKWDHNDPGSPPPSQ